MSSRTSFLCSNLKIIDVNKWIAAAHFWFQKIWPLRDCFILFSAFGNSCCSLIMNLILNESHSQNLQWFNTNFLVVRRKGSVIKMCQLLLLLSSLLISIHIMCWPAPILVLILIDIIQHSRIWEKLYYLQTGWYFYKLLMFFIERDRARSFRGCSTHTILHCVHHD